MIIEQQDVFICLECGEVSTFTSGSGWEVKDKQFLFNKMNEYQLLTIISKKYGTTIITDGAWKQQEFHFGVLCGKCAQKHYYEYYFKIKSLQNKSSDINLKYYDKMQNDIIAQLQRTIDRYVYQINLDFINDLGKNSNIPYAITKMEDFDPKSFVKACNPSLINHVQKYVSKSCAIPENDKNYALAISEIEDELNNLSNWAFYVKPKFSCRFDANCHKPKGKQFIKDLDENIETFQSDMFYWVIPLKFTLKNNRPGAFNDIRGGLIFVSDSFSEGIPDECKFVKLHDTKYYWDQALSNLTSGVNSYLTRKVVNYFGSKDKLNF